ncbi:unnamed protein product [Rotaria socialis]|uniref:P-type domain-containing protein n=1 Tax=Rotaria socialis TaxID=392032 RepID=A0A821LE73_9BILA|nr:unnamed protein product [Rotaria socialis]
MAHFSVAKWIVMLFFVSSASAQQCDQPVDSARFDCHPEPSVSQQSCLDRNCCWKPIFSPAIRLLKNHSTNYFEGVPWCYYPRDFPTYQIKTNESTSFGQRLTIVKRQSTYMPNEILNLTVDLIYETAQRFRLRIYDSTEKRFEVPLQVPAIETKANATDYEVSLSQTPFAILVKRKSTRGILFDSSASPLIYADQFIKFSSHLSSPFLYGLGEHRQPLLINVTNEWRKLTFWARDIGPAEGVNLYGVHPFHINVEMNHNNTQTNFHGQFFLNSNAMDVDLQPLPAITYTTIGGIIDLYLFTGPTAQDVIQQYWDVIGKPAMPAYWSLGFHLCRWGYNNIDNLRAVVQRMRAAEFPYDVQWTDIDAMSSHLDFTYDQTNFNGLPDLIHSLQSEGKHYVNIIDPGISSTQPSGTYPPYDDGMKRAIFMTKFNSTEPITGQVWPGLTVFPDFTNASTIEWWTNIAATFHDIVPFDGIWIVRKYVLELVVHSKKSVMTLIQFDMNEPSNFIDGSQDGCTNNSLDKPPFVPNVVGSSLSAKTLCPSAQHALSFHYNLHNMFGYFEAKATNLALQTIRQKRAFVLSRSSFAGSGQYTAHWTGDNRATFEDMYFSIPGTYINNAQMEEDLFVFDFNKVFLSLDNRDYEPTEVSPLVVKINNNDNQQNLPQEKHLFIFLYILAILSFNMFGVPYVGADICGFGLDTTEELCTRWMQLGAFYPFMRNHNAIGQKDQDPAAFSLTTQQIMKQALLMRYSLAPFWYTLYHKAAMVSRTLVQPLHFEFPNDNNTLGIDQQFLIGSAILVSPSLVSVNRQRQTTTVHAYIPQDVWYQFPSGVKVQVAGIFTDLDAPLEKINVHVRGGFIIPMQIPGANLVMGRQNPFILLVAQSAAGNASGNLFWDDGDSIDSIETKTYNYFEFSLVSNALTIHAIVTNYKDSPMRLEIVRILGISKLVTSVTVNEKDYKNFSYNIADQILVVDGLDMNMLAQSSQTIAWTTTIN